ncbi:MAG TPA: hypothetical protein VEA59_06005 [Patescibacteria group bacterium]|nr:hypothetical protein [Patescibacteria group bacterium]
MPKKELQKNQFPERRGLEDEAVEESIESVELKMRGGISSYLDSVTPEELKHRVISALSKIDDPHKLRFKLQELGLSEKPSNEELLQAIEKHIEGYQQRVAQVREFIPTHLPKLNEWLDREGYTPRQRPEDIPVIVNDYLLHSGVENDFPHVFGEFFNGEENFITITGKHGNNVTAHEYVHGIAFDPETKTGGFIAEGGKNVWLDEGVTMLGEFATYPTKVPGRRDDPEELYDDGYMWLTRIYMQEVGVSEQDLFKAYFGTEPQKTELEKKTQRRFGCSVVDLQGLFLGYSQEAKENVLKIIKGEVVVLEAMEGSGVDQHFTELQKIFPNIEVVVTPLPKFEENEKQREWERARVEVEQIVDDIGKGLDKGIKETIVAFKALGFSTNQSCEGHESADDGMPYPWVQFYVGSPNGREEDEESQLESQRKNEIDREKLSKLLDEFYATRNPQPDARLVFEDIGSFGSFRLRSQGAATIASLSEETVRREKLNEYREEMYEFTQFLKQKFLEEK